MNVYLFIFPLVALACNVSSEQNHLQQNENPAEQKTKNTFSEFLTAIPAYSFPVNMSCDYERLPVNLESGKYEQYIPSGGRVVAKLNTPADYTLIIFDFACDYSCPRLYSYHQKGVRIDSLDLTPGQCGEDEFSKKTEWFLVDENIQIELLDKTEYYSTTQSKRNLDSTIVVTKKYQLNAQGKFDLVSMQSDLQAE